MARGHGTRQPLDVSRESAVDRLEERTAAAGVLRWGFVLTWFMRLLAVLWIIKGLSAWAVILGMWSPVGVFGLVPPATRPRSSTSRSSISSQR